MSQLRKWLRPTWLRWGATAAFAAMMIHALPALAADKVKAAKSVDVAWAFIPLDVGVQEGIFAKYNIDVDITAFSGDAKLQQAFAANAIDVGTGSGPAMAFSVKGAPALMVAPFAGPSGTISLTVLPDSPIKSAADMKGKTAAISTTGSLTEWLVKRLSVKEGWGPDGVKAVALGAGAAMNGALFTHQVDAMMTGTENSYLLVDKGQARVVTGMESFAPDFMTHVIFARKDLIASNPDLVSRFLKGFFAAVRFAKENRDETIKVLSPVLNEPPKVLGLIYDHETPILLDDGHIDPKAVDVIKDSFIDMGILDTKPSDDQLFTRQFVPVTP